ncbi:hypothetical protein D9758_005453 [Tetrapyrgos nigripes]|uniref:Cytochrome P450 n=1 Tax=Tetrapyrgos nigripes TaxID=182062 RepID=A0A8H5GIA4_9AGAR|nr:hypothetical protein D9758_005453 [Tetrapyrgos nigripes]
MVYKGSQEKVAVNSRNLFKILCSKLLLIFALVNFAIQLPLLIQVSLINHDLANSPLSSPSALVGSCGFSLSVFNRIDTEGFATSINEKLNQDNDAIVTMVYSQFATLLVVIVSSFSDSFSPYFSICSFILIQIMWTSVQIGETEISDGNCQTSASYSFLGVGDRILLENTKTDARTLTRHRARTLTKGAENLFHISAYLWIGVSLLFAAGVDVTSMSVSMVLVVVSLSVTWFRLGWLSIHQRSRSDPLLFFLVGITIILVFATSRSIIQDFSSWPFYIASLALSIVLAILSHVVAVLAMWYSRTNGDHLELPERPNETSFLPVTRPFSSNAFATPPSNTEIPVVSPPFSPPPIVPPSMTRPGCVQSQVMNQANLSASEVLPQSTISEALRNTVRIESQLSSPPPPSINPSTRPSTFATRPNGLAQTSVMRRPSGRREQDSSIDQTGSVSASQAVPSTPPLPFSLPSLSPPTPLTLLPVPPPPPLIILPLIVPPPPSLPQPDSPTNSDASSQRPAVPSQTIFNPPSRPQTPPSQANTTIPPSSFRYFGSSSSSSSSSRRTSRAPPDVPVSPTRRDTLASDVSFETLPSYRSRSNTPVTSVPPQLPFSFNVPPLPPLPPNYPSLPSTPAQFLTRRPTNSSVRTFATLPSYRSMTTPTGSDSGSETGDFTESSDDRELLSREEEQLPISNGRRSSQRSIMNGGNMTPGSLQYGLRKEAVEKANEPFDEPDPKSQFDWHTLNGNVLEVSLSSSLILLPYRSGTCLVPSKKFWLTYIEWGKKYGGSGIELTRVLIPIRAILDSGDLIHFTRFGKHYLVLNSLQAARDILDKQTRITSDRANAQLDRISYFEEFITFQPYSDKWRKSRRLFHQIFRADATSQFRPIQTRQIYDFVESLRSSKYTLKDQIATVSQKIMFEAIYGLEISSNREEMPANNRELIDIDVGSDSIFTPGWDGFKYIPFIQYLPSWFPNGQLIAAHHVLGKMTQDGVNKPWDAVQEKIAHGDHSSLIANLLSGIDPENREEIHTIKWFGFTCVVVAADTTMSAISTFFLAMSLYPHVQSKGQEELNTVLGKGRMPTFDDRPSLPFIEAIFREVMRWHPALPMGVAHDSLEDIIYEGYYIPKGTSIYANIWAMTHDASVYKDPDQFIPERHLRNDGHFDNINSILAYGFGRRVCVGRYMANDTIWLAIAATLAAVEISSLPNENVEDYFTDGSLCSPESNTLNCLTEGRPPSFLPSTMLIRLLPVPSQPTVLFKLTFENLPHHLVYPSSWANQLAALSCDDLEVPELVHALDKAVGTQSILEEVTFDLVHSKIKCVFVDGEVEEWAFGTCLDRSRGPADSFHVPKEYDSDSDAVAAKLDVTRRLESVLADVNESAAEMDREKKREEERLRLKKEEEEKQRTQQQKEENGVVSAVAPTDASGKKKHKKNKSMLLNLVSAILPMSLNSPADPKSPRLMRSPKASSLPSSPVHSRSPSPSRSPRISSVQSESAKSDAGCSSAPASLSRASSLSAMIEYSRGDIKAFAGWNRRRRGRRPFSTSFADLPVDIAAEETQSDGALTANVSAAHTPEASEHSTNVEDSIPNSENPSTSPKETEPPIVVVAPPPAPPLTPRALRRRARSTLVDTFRMYIIPELTRRVRCGQYFSTALPTSPSISMVNSATQSTLGSSTGLTIATSASSTNVISTGSSNSDSVYTNPASGLSAPVPTIPLYHPNNVGGDSILYYVWVVGSMMKRVEARIGEVVREAREEMERLEMGGVSLRGSFSSVSSLDSLYHTAVTTISASSSAAQSPTTATPPIYHEGVVGVASAVASPFGAGNSSSEGSSKESLTSTSEATGSGSTEYESDTDTDGSSLHTPTGVVFQDPFVASDSLQMSAFGTEDMEGYKPHNSKSSPSSDPPAYSPSDSTSSASLNSPTLNHQNVNQFTFDDPSQETPTPAPPPVPTQPLSPQLTSLLSQHTQLTALHTHLHHLLILAHARVSSASADAGQREVMLEVRGRRRAWLNGSYRLHNRIQGTLVSGTPTSPTSLTNTTVLSRAGIAMATTSHTSPLGRYSWSSDEWDCDPFAYLELSLLPYRRRSSSDKSTPVSPIGSGPTSPFLECYPNPFESEGEGLDGGASYGVGANAHRKKSSISETTLLPVEEDDESEGEGDGEESGLGSSSGPISGSEFHHQTHRVKLNFGVSLYRHIQFDVDDASSDEDEDSERDSGEGGTGVDEDDEDLLRDIDALVDVELDVPEDRDEMPFEQGGVHKHPSGVSEPVLTIQKSLTKGKEQEESSASSISVSPTSSTKSVGPNLGPNLLVPGHDFTLAMDAVDIDVADNIDNVIDPLDGLPPRRKSIAMMAAANSMKMSQNEVINALAM